MQVKSCFYLPGINFQFSVYLINQLNAKFAVRQVNANNTDPDQTAPKRFAILSEAFSKWKNSIVEFFFYKI